MYPIETSAEIKNISAALMKFQAMSHGVVKDQVNPHFRNRYASLEAVIETARPGLQASGLAFTQAPGLATSGVLPISTMLIHSSSGEWIHSTTGMPITKNDAQGVGSALTYGLRYALMAMLGLPPLDDDAEATKPQPKQKGAPEPFNAPERQLPPPPNDSRSIYVRNSLADIENFDDPEKLAAWLDQEAELAWPDFGITKHDPDGQKIFMACKKRRLELKAAA